MNRIASVDFAEFLLTPEQRGDGDQPLEEVEAAIGVGAFEPRDTGPRPSCNSNEPGLGWKRIAVRVRADPCPTPG
jgi:hypothetical protein